MSIIKLVLLLLLSLHHSCSARILRVARHDGLPHDSLSKENDVEKVINNGGRGFRSEVEEKDEYEAARRKWRVPRNKRGGEEAAGFNLDYLPPRTHPPVHN